MLTFAKVGQDIFLPRCERIALRDLFLPPSMCTVPALRPVVLRCAGSHQLLPNNVATQGGPPSRLQQPRQRYERQGTNSGYGAFFTTIYKARAMFSNQNSRTRYSRSVKRSLPLFP